MNKNLLEYLAEESDCLFLSDLYLPWVLPKLSQPIACLGQKVFPLEEWNEAISYILGKTMKFSSVEEAKKYFMDFMKCYNAEREE